MGKLLSNYLYDLAKKNKKKLINVKVGCIGGTSFFYCHPLDKNTIQVIDKLYDKHKKKSLRQLGEYEYKLANLDSIYDKLILESLKANKKERVNKREINEEKWVAKQLLKKEEERKRIPTIIKQLKYNIEHSFLNREIKEIVDSTDIREMPCKVIYIKGYERGEYWSVKEYVKENKE